MRHAHRSRFNKFVGYYNNRGLRTSNGIRNLLSMVWPSLMASDSHVSSLKSQQDLIHPSHVLVQHTAIIRTDFYVPTSSTSKKRKHIKDINSTDLEVIVTHVRQEGTGTCTLSPTELHENSRYRQRYVQFICTAHYANYLA